MKAYSRGAFLSHGTFLSRRKTSSFGVRLIRTPDSSSGHARLPQADGAPALPLFRVRRPSQNSCERNNFLATGNKNAME